MEESQTAANWNPNLGIQVYVTWRKGVVLWLPREVNSELEMLGYGGCRVDLKSDQENAVMGVKRSVAAERSSPTSMLESPVRESQSNGKMERLSGNGTGSEHGGGRSVPSPMHSIGYAIGRQCQSIGTWLDLTARLQWHESQGRSAPEPQRNSEIRSYSRNPARNTSISQRRNGQKEHSWVSGPGQERLS